MLCEFTSDGDFDCEDCNTAIPQGDTVHWFPDGGESSDGTYTCGSCAVKREP